MCQRLKVNSQMYRHVLESRERKQLKPPSCVIFMIRKEIARNVKDGDLIRPYIYQTLALQLLLTD